MYLSFRLGRNLADTIADDRAYLGEHIAENARETGQGGHGGDCNQTGCKRVFHEVLALYSRFEPNPESHHLFSLSQALGAPLHSHDSIDCRAKKSGKALSYAPIQAYLHDA